MGLQRASYLLNRPGTRWLLGGLATARAQLRGNRQRIFYDAGVWIHRFDEGCIADWQPNPSRNLGRQLAQRRRFWLAFYHPRPGDVVIDVGAGSGVEALMFSRALGGRGRIVAIEAHPRTYECLVKTCKHNRLHDVTPLNLALTDREQSISIEDSAQHIGNSIAPGAAHGTVQVRGSSLDDLCSELGIESIACIRMNIEGAEALAVRGMERMIRRTSVAMIACHDFKADRTGNEFFRTKQTIREFLLDHGFELAERSFPEPWANDYVFARQRALAADLPESTPDAAFMPAARALGASSPQPPDSNAGVH